MRDWRWWLVMVAMMSMGIGVGLSGCRKDEPAPRDENHRPGVGDNSQEPGGNENGNGQNGGENGDSGENGSNGGEQGGNGGENPAESRGIVGVWLETTEGKERLAFEATGDFTRSRLDEDWEVVEAGTYTYNESKRWLDLYSYSDGAFVHSEYKCVLDRDAMTLTDTRGKTRKYTRTDS